MDFDQIRADAEQAYTNFVVTANGEDLVMLSPLRLKRTDREKLTDLMDKIESGEVDQEDALEQIILTVSESAKTSRALLALTKDDFATRTMLITRYQEAVSLGEASDSPS